MPVGKYVTVWKKKDGNWIVSDDIFNPDKLAKSAATFQVHGNGPFVVNYVNPAEQKIGMAESYLLKTEPTR